jgi:uncharacterized protein YcbX
MTLGRMTVTLAHLYRFPVKGLRAEALDAARVAAGGGLPEDRRFAIVRGNARVDPAAPGWLPKQRCVMLMRDAELARLACRVDFDAGTIDLAEPDTPPCRASFATAEGWGRLEAFLNAFLGARPDGPVRLVEAGRLSFTDVPQNCLSLVNLASVAALGTAVGQTLDPLRFRANLYVAGAPAWAEFDWVGHRLTLGDVTLRIASRIPRCAATAVNPATAERDVNLVKALRAHFGHVDMGVYGEVERGGRLAVGDTLTPPDAARPRSWLAHRLRFAAFLARSGVTLLRGR